MTWAWRVEGHGPHVMFTMARRAGSKSSRDAVSGLGSLSSITSDLSRKERGDPLRKSLNQIQMVQLAARLNKTIS